MVNIITKDTNRLIIIIFNGQKTKRRIWFQLTETREKKTAICRTLMRFPLSLGGKYSSTKHQKCQAQDSDWNVKCVTQYFIPENSQEFVRIYFSISRCAADFIS